MSLLELLSSAVVVREQSLAIQIAWISFNKPLLIRMGGWVVSGPHVAVCKHLVCTMKTLPALWVSYLSQSPREGVGNLQAKIKQTNKQTLTEMQMVTPSPISTCDSHSRRWFCLLGHYKIMTSPFIFLKKEGFYYNFVARITSLVKFKRIEND